MLSANEIIDLLGLEPLEPEGGCFAETYRAREQLAAAALPPRYAGARAAATAIYYLLTATNCSRLHRLASDELFHFYLGDPVEMLQLGPDGTGHVALLGNDLRAGMRPQILVPRGVWQGARVRAGGALALLGTTVAPGFELADYECGCRDRLEAAYPEHAALIRELMP